MHWKTIGKRLLFPPLPILLPLLPCALGGMLYGMEVLGDTHPLTIAAYALSFYALCIWCLRVPELIRRWKAFRRENKYLRRWLEDRRLRMNVTVGASVLWNGAYGALQLGLGIYHRSYWFFTLAVYYVSLAAMRLFLVKHTLRHSPGENRRQELIACRRCGWFFLLVNLALSAMMLQRIRDNHLTPHHPITTIAMAAFTFTTLTMAIVNVVKYRKYHSPVLWAAKAISLASACVSLLSLEDTMLVTFGTGDMTAKTRQLFLALSGGGVSAGILVMAAGMLLETGKQMNRMETEHGK